MGSIRVLLDDWPIVIHRSEGSPTEAELDAYVQEATAVLRRCEKHVVVMDATQLKVASSYSRMLKKDWLQENAELLRKCCLGTALVLSSPILRFISSTFMMIRPFPVPYYVCETMDEALVWARARLREGGVAGP